MAIRLVLLVANLLMHTFKLELADEHVTLDSPLTLSPLLVCYLLHFIPVAGLGMPVGLMTKGHGGCFEGGGQGYILESDE